ncbi:diaminopimelate epimerase [Thioalkalivibrio sp. HK1]|uniref:diaminopimelate epimerase n=1 Tax=Thioalkalivibrio sp. HK1 TaxID=1469245 RepID=UPI0004704DEF|nr:diaminopimelate epimerase [Thioalkalivibrio sp. HK1]
MRFRFTKMHGIGNDFVVADALRTPLPDASRIRFLADRRRGVGCDQILLAVPPTDPSDSEADLGVAIFNADGSRAGHCGNGMRCMALFARQSGLVDKDEMILEIIDPPISDRSMPMPSHRVRATIDPDKTVRVEMGTPRFEPEAIPIAIPRYEPVQSKREPAQDKSGDPSQSEPGPRQSNISLMDADGLHCLVIAGEPLQFAALSMGNPHAVLRVADTDAAPVRRIGAALQDHPFFPQGVNAGFMQIVAPDRIRLRVFERGVGETPACGSGACAAVVAGRRSGDLADGVQVELPGGIVEVSWPKEGETVHLSGTATKVFEGEIDL